MTKPYTPDDLSNQFLGDLTWRRKEFSDLKAAIRFSDEAARRALRRALVAMVYAHWEGYIKYCARLYFEHLTMRRLPYSKFERQFYINSFLNRLPALGGGGSISERCEFIQEILDGPTAKFSRVSPNLIDTRSNLNTDVMIDICRICGVDHVFFESHREFIDLFILKRRNAIAHGQPEFIADDDVDEFVGKALALMDHFRAMLENKIHTKSYLAA